MRIIGEIEFIILRKVILDDSYLPGLDYLSQKFVGDEISVAILRNHWLTQQDVVNKVTQQIKYQSVHSPLKMSLKY